MFFVTKIIDIYLIFVFVSTSAENEIKFDRGSYLKI